MILHLRRAELSDALDVLNWRNDPLARAMSRNEAPIDEDAHMRWFARAVEDGDCTLLIAELSDIKVGMVRIDYGSETEISINVNPAHRGRNVGKQLLRSAIEIMPGDLVAYIKEENLQSRRLFEQSGFTLTGSEGGLMRYVRPGNLTSAENDSAQ